MLNSVNEIGAATPSRQRRSTAATHESANEPLTAAAPIGETAEARARESVSYPLSLADLIGQIVEWQKQRRFCLKAQVGQDNAMTAFLVRASGITPDSGEADRKKTWEQAADYRVAVEKAAKAANDLAAAIRKGAGESAIAKLEKASEKAKAAQAGPLGAVLAQYTTMILNNAAARGIWDRHRDHLETLMIKAARQLPVYPFVRNVAGFGDLGLAKLVGETGDLSGYDSVPKLWKRLGLAVIGGVRQQKVSGANALQHGYNPARRSEVWNIADPMFRHQWAGAKEDGFEAHPKGPYGAYYGRRKADLLARNESGDNLTRAAAIVERTSAAGKAPNPINLEGKLTPKHIDNDARRYMTKALIRDLWREWRKTDPDRAESVPQRAGTPENAPNHVELDTGRRAA